MNSDSMKRQNRATLQLALNVIRQWLLRIMHITRK